MKLLIVDCRLLIDCRLIGDPFSNHNQKSIRNQQSEISNFNVHLLRSTTQSSRWNSNRQRRISPNAP